MPAQKSIISGADFSSTIALDQRSATFPQSRLKQALQGMAGRTNFPPKIRFSLLFVMLLKIENL